MNEPPLRLTSLQNDQVKALVRLRNRRERDQRQVLVIEEPLVIARALAAGYTLATLYYCPELVQAEDKPLLQSLQASVGEVVEVNAPVMAKISYRDQSAGLLVVAPQRTISLDQLPLPENSPALYIVLENVEKPGNLGAVLRVADGAGADAVIVCGQSCDASNPNVLRASRGANFTVPTVACNHDELAAFLAERKVVTVATAPNAETTWDGVDLDQPVAILLGAEHEGLSAKLLAQASLTVSLPMQGSGDSLNVATTAAILLFEAVRQRRAGL